MEKKQIYRMADKRDIWLLPIVPKISISAVKASAEDSSVMEYCEIRQRTTEEYTHHRCADHDAYVYWLPDVLRLPPGYRAYGAHMESGPGASRDDNLDLQDDDEPW